MKYQLNQPPVNHLSVEYRWNSRAHQFGISGHQYDWSKLNTPIIYRFTRVTPTISIYLGWVDFGGEEGVPKRKAIDPGFWTW